MHAKIVKIEHFFATNFAYQQINISNKKSIYAHTYIRHENIHWFKLEKIYFFSAESKA